MGCNPGPQHAAFQMFTFPPPSDGKYPITTNFCFEGLVNPDKLDHVAECSRVLEHRIICASCLAHYNTLTTFKRLDVYVNQHGIMFMGQCRRAKIVRARYCDEIANLHDTCWHCHYWASKLEDLDLAIKTYLNGHG
jgi:hypothetical protein